MPGRSGCEATCCRKALVSGTCFEGKSPAVTLGGLGPLRAGRSVGRLQRWDALDAASGKAAAAGGWEGAEGAGVGGREVRGQSPEDRRRRQALRPGRACEEGHAPGQGRGRAHSQSSGKPGKD